jgi:hypothetical protein
VVKLSSRKSIVNTSHCDRYALTYFSTKRQNREMKVVNKRKKPFFHRVGTQEEAERTLIPKHQI